MVALLQNKTKCKGKTKGISKSKSKRATQSNGKANGCVAAVMSSSRHMG